MGRIRIQKVIWVFLLLMVFTTPAFANEFRGLWVDAFGPGFYNSNQVAALVSDCRKYNFNAVIVEMRARADASYFPHPPNHDVRRTFVGPAPSDFDPDYDALADIIKQCHTGIPRIEVHCWVVAQYVWAAETPPRLRNHVFNLHPEYLTKDSVAQTFIQKGYFLDPGNPDACQWNHDMAMDIVSHYDIDGFHWDYVRYPNQDSGYNETALARYNAEFGLTGQPLPKDTRFSAWRRRQVTDFVRWVDADMLAIKPKLVISASVFANYQDAYGFRFQDWVEWNKEGIIDVAMPMDFATNNSNIFNPEAKFALTNQWLRRVYLGQAAYLNPKQDTLAQLNYIRDKGFAGFCFYSYRTSASDETNNIHALQYLRETFQTNWTATPGLPWKNNPTRGIIRGTVTDKKNGKPVYNAEVALDDVGNHSQKTEPHGKYAFFETAPGTRTVLVKTQSGTTKGETVVKAGEVTTLNLEIDE